MPPSPYGVGMKMAGVLCTQPNLAGLGTSAQLHCWKLSGKILTNLKLNVHLHTDRTSSIIVQMYKDSKK